MGQLLPMMRHDALYKYLRDCCTASSVSCWQRDESYTMNYEPWKCYHLPTKEEVIARYEEESKSNRNNTLSVNATAGTVMCYCHSLIDQYVDPPLRRHERRLRRLEEKLASVEEALTGVTNKTRVPPGPAADHNAESREGEVSVPEGETARELAIGENCDAGDREAGQLHTTTTVMASDPEALAAEADSHQGSELDEDPLCSAALNILPLHMLHKLIKACHESFSMTMDIGLRACHEHQLLRSGPATLYILRHYPEDVPGVIESQEIQKKFHIKMFHAEEEKIPLLTNVALASSLSIDKGNREVKRLLKYILTPMLPTLSTQCEWKLELTDGKGESHFPGDGKEVGIVYAIVKAERTKPKAVESRLAQSFNTRLNGFGYPTGGLFGGTTKPSGSLFGTQTSSSDMVFDTTTPTSEA